MIAVIIATAGRPHLVPMVLAQLGRQTRQPDWIVIAHSKPGDLPQDIGALAAAVGCNTATVTSPLGLANQRNTGLNWLVDNSTVFSSNDNMIVFFDDDFVPREDWLDTAARIFRSQQDVVGITGALIADGIKKPGYTHQDADRMISGSRDAPAQDRPLRTATLYGCNMAIRSGAARLIRFDEVLPLYAWQEDFDYSQRIARAGRVVLAPALVGVHLGVKGGRVSGRRFGYSQIANPYYLLSKGTMGPRKALRLVVGNLVSNLAKAPFPEPYVDRVGRLTGNVMGFRDLLTGRLDPRRILQM